MFIHIAIDHDKSIWNNTQYADKRTKMKKIKLKNKDLIASFDVDCQNTFTPLCPDELPVPGGTEIIDELNRQAQFAKYRIGSKDAHSPYAIWVASKNHPQFSPIDGDNVDVRWKRHRHHSFP